MVVRVTFALVIISDSSSLRDVGGHVVSHRPGLVGLNHVCLVWVRNLAGP